MFNMMIVKVPQREASPVFVGRDWVFREIQEQFNSSLPTNRGILISGQGLIHSGIKLDQQFTSTYLELLIWYKLDQQFTSTYLELLIWYKLD